MKTTARRHSVAATPTVAAARTLAGNAAARQPVRRRTPSGSDRLAEALKACRVAARQGYRNALERCRELDVAVAEAAQEIESKQAELGQGGVHASDAARNLKDQLGRIDRELDDMRAKFRASTEAQAQRLDEFSIALFGRTMAGKSTLMEILTGGSGESIGNGAQRTTRDVRTYHWRGLRVTDVPGVAAFEGKEDEELAFQAAADADLVILLITDDAPQPAEADCLARLRELGKPVLGICNVKFTVKPGANPALVRRRAEKAFDPQRLDALVAQFRELAAARLPRDGTAFVCTHLRARYLAAHESDHRRRDALAEVSRFDRVEREIVSAVTGQGTFLRARSFIEAASGPMLEMMDSLLEFSAQTASSGRVLLNKKRQTAAWRRDFRTSGRTRIDTGVRDIVEHLRASIPSFAEQNYDRWDAGERWAREVEAHDVDGAVARLQKRLATECGEHLARVAKEFEVEIELVGGFEADRSISMPRITDTRRILNWAAALVNIATIAMRRAGPLAWAISFATNVVFKFLSQLFDDRPEKERRQRKKLEAKLRKDVGRYEKQVRCDLGKWFNEDLMGQVNALLADMSALTSGLFHLANTQRALAWKLNPSLKTLHRELLCKAWDHLGTGEPMPRMIRDVARVPGTGRMLLVDPESGLHREAQRRFGMLLGESVWIAKDTGNRFSVLCQAIGIRRPEERREVSVEEDIQVAHVPVGLLTPERRARIRLAQQLVELHVMKGRGSRGGTK